jgi:hypothetical protein
MRKTPQHRIEGLDAIDGTPSMITLQEPYQTRPIRFLELWQETQWRIKVYGIAYRRPLPRPELINAAKHVARSHLLSVEGQQQHGVGFLGVHDGRGANFVFIDYWADENELHHHVYVSPANKPEALEYVTPSGLIACVWDLRVMWFERQAWVETVLANPAGPDVEQYVLRRLNEEA